MVWLVRVRLTLMLLVLYFSALEIENTDAGTDNLDDKDLVISGTASPTSADCLEGLSKKMKKRKYHWLNSNSVILELMKGLWREKESRERSTPAFEDLSSTMFSFSSSTLVTLPSTT